MPNVVKITVENPDEILNAGLYGSGALIRLQTSATEAGAFADVSGTGSTPTLTVVTGTRLYTGYDPAGTSSSWYRTRYENVGATRLSDWTAAFQVGDETAGFLCSLYDVEQRMFGSATVASGEKETLLDIIREVSNDIEDFVGAWLAPRPTDPSSTMTLLFDVERTTRVLRLETGHRRIGIRTLTALSTATTSQPESGGTYTAATLANVLLRPRPTADGPATELVFVETSSGWFYPGYNTVSATGAFGPASVASRIQGIAIEAVTRRYIGKERAEPAAFLGPEGGVRLLRNISPDSVATLVRMRVPAVA